MSVIGGDIYGVLQMLVSGGGVRCPLPRREDRRLEHEPQVVARQTAVAAVDGRAFAGRPAALYDSILSDQRHLSNTVTKYPTLVHCFNIDTV